MELLKERRLQPGRLSETRLEIQKLNQLPPLSVVAEQFLVAVEDPDLEVRQMAAIVERDPALLGRLISLANSAYFGYPHPVVTAEDAIFKVLGLTTAKCLALGIILSGPFDATQCRTFRLDRYWTRALTVAVLAKRLAPAIKVDPEPSSGDAYLCGLLHNLGILALVHLYPVPMAGVFGNERAEQPAGLIALEREVLGSDHGMVGGWLARKWQLPENVVAVMEHYMDDEYKGEHQVYVTLIRRCVDWVVDLEQCEPEQVAEFKTKDLAIDAAKAQQIANYVRQSYEEIKTVSRALAHGR